MDISKSNVRRSRTRELHQPVYILSGAGIVGKKEGEGPFGKQFDQVIKDGLLGQADWETAESELQRKALATAMVKAEIFAVDIDCMFAGDLLSQSTASSFGLVEFAIPHYGIYGACSNCGESLALGSIMVSAGYAKIVAAVTSSHFASAEKEFRYPLAYGSQRPLSSTWTVTGSGAFLLGSEKREACLGKITAITMGEMVDPGIKDFQNMGVCMAPAAALTILSAIKELPYGLEGFDKIITGDLGSVGSNALYDLLRKEGVEIEEKHLDCGLLIYDRNSQDVHAGGSGCGCSATMLSAFILNEIKRGIWKRVLFAPTGALLSKVRSQEGMSIPGISHGVVIESL